MTHEGKGSVGGSSSGSTLQQLLPPSLPYPFPFLQLSSGQLSTAIMHSKVTLLFIMVVTQ